MKGKERKKIAATPRVASFLHVVTSEALSKGPGCRMKEKKIAISAHMMKGSHPEKNPKAKNARIAMYEMILRAFFPRKVSAM